MLLLLGLTAATAAGAAPPRGIRAPRLMATLPAGSVDGVSEVMQVWEDLRDASSPIIFRGATSSFAITKSGESIVAQNESALWGGREAHDVMHSEADVLGNSLLQRDSDPSFEDIVGLLPPILVGKLSEADFSLDTQSFVGSRIGSEKRAFSATGAGAHPSGVPCRHSCRCSQR
jgi:hypothetical protein